MVYDCKSETQSKEAEGSASTEVSSKMQYDYVDPKDDFLCEICTMPYVDPVRTSCLHYFCNGCIQEYYNHLRANSSSSNSEFSCPTCRQSLGDKFELIPETSPMILKYLANMRVYCAHKQNGCNWQGSRVDLPTHLSQHCEFNVCLNSYLGCPWKGKDQEIQQHLLSDCVCTTVNCRYRSEFLEEYGLCCEFQTTRKNMPNHELSCPVLLQIQQMAKEKAEREAREAKEREEREAKEAQERAEREAQEAKEAAEREVQRILEEKRQAKHREVMETVRLLQLQQQQLIQLNIGGTFVTTDKETLQSDPESVLAYLCEEAFQSAVKSGGASTPTLFLNYNFEEFKGILNWLRSGDLPSIFAFEQRKDMLRIAQYLRLDKLVKVLQQPISTTGVKVTTSDITQILQSPLRSIELNGMDLSGIWLAGFAMKSANLARCNLKNTYFLGADLSYSNFYQADAEGANFYRAALDGACLQEVNLTRAQMLRASLNGANLSKAKLLNAKLPTNLTRVDLSHCDLSTVSSESEGLAGCDLSRAKLEGACLAGVNLSQANLTEVNLKGADLSGADLRGANLRDAKLTGANLTNVNLTSATVICAVFSNCNCFRADFTSVDTRLADFDKANLSETKNFVSNRYHY